MPYIITTTTPGVPPVREATDTRFNAADIAAHIIEWRTGADEAYEEMYTDAQNVSALGDTFGPLPDGTMIEVKPITADQLADMARQPRSKHGFYSQEHMHDLIDAFDAQQ